MKYIRVIILICLMLGLFMPIPTHADESVGLSVEYGINGKIQMGRGFPLTITLTNNGEDLSGDLMIFSSPNYEAAGNIIVPVELSRGEKKSLRLSIPGHDDRFFYQQNPNNQQPLVRLFKGDWEDGKEVELDGSATSKPSVFPENRLVIGVLSDTPDSLNFLKLTRFNAESVEFLSLKEENLSNDPTGFEVFDVILINDFNVSNLSIQKQQAMIGWVNSGGHLMIGSNPGILEQLGEVQELSLLTVKNQISFDELNVFPKTSNEVSPSFKSLEIMTGDLQENTKVLVSDHSLPLVINKSFGLGEVTQFSFNIGNETLNSWEPYQRWWEDIYQKAVDKDVYGPKRYMIENIYSQIGDVVEAFPSSFLPLTALIVLFIVYLLFLVPGLYIILKKLDKREISWWIIPAVALISSIGIFIVGAKDRIAGSQLNDVSVLAIGDNGRASGYGAISMLTNSGGDYSLTIKPKEFNAFPMAQNYNGVSFENLLEFPMVEQGHEQTKITFKDVEYWSIRSSIGSIQSTEIGKLLSDLRVENDKLVGTIDSTLSINIEEAYLLVGSKAYPIGKIQAGTTENIAIDLENKSIENTIGAPLGMVAATAFPGFNNNPYGGPTDRNDLKDWKKYQLLQTVINQRIYQKNLNQPLLAGFTSDSLIDVTIDKKQAKSTSLTLITQAVEVTPMIEGEFTLTEKGLQPELSIFESNEGFIHHNGLLAYEDYIAVENGKYQLRYQLPKQIEPNKVDLKKLKLSLSRENGTTYFIFDTQAGEFMSLADQKAIVTFEENANDFLAEDGSILLMFEKTGMSNPEVRVPTINIEGEYKK